MRSMVAVMMLGLLGACAAQARRPVTIEMESARQVEAMRRAPRVATRHLALSSSCLMQDGALVRSLTPSATCIACHDGTSSAPVRLHDMHRTSVEYEREWLKGTAGLREPAALPPAIVLVSGTTVECTSCHDPGSPQPHLTAMTLDRSTLCLGCHTR
jgi:predicted CXXCH cytochrome family protein